MLACRSYSSSAAQRQLRRASWRRSTGPSGRSHGVSGGRGSSRACWQYAARDNKKTRIIPRHLQLAIRNDEELNKLLSGVMIARGGVLPKFEHPGCSASQEDAEGVQVASRCSTDNFHLTTTTGSFQSHPHLRRRKSFLRFGSYHISIIFHVNSSPTILHISIMRLIH